MISEKTVELNVTTELLNWLSYHTGVVHTAIGPSQVEEGTVGYDVSVHGGATAAALIQYKRAYVAGSVWTWHLNRTKRRDQHARLQLLQSRHFPVFYALPHFATASEVVSLRKRLLVHTSWFPPLSISPPGGPLGYHEVEFDTATSAWTVSSTERQPLQPPLRIRDVVDRLLAAEHEQQSIEEFAGAINRVMQAAETDGLVAGVAEDAGASFAGQALLLRHGNAAANLGAA